MYVVQPIISKLTTALSWLGLRFGGHLVLSNKKNQVNSHTGCGYDDSTISEVCICYTGQKANYCYFSYIAKQYRNMHVDYLSGNILITMHCQLL